MPYSKVEGARLEDVCFQRDPGHWEVLRESMGAGAVQETLDYVRFIGSTNTTRSNIA
jgi:hypothetical protein